jgi:hypothetical protein
MDAAAKICSLDSIHDYYAMHTGIIGLVLVNLIAERNVRLKGFWKFPFTKQNDHGRDRNPK